MRAQLTSSVVERLLAEAAEAHPLECCGLLLGGDQEIIAAHPARNVHPEPSHNFEIDPRTLVEAHRAARNGGAQVVGYYHSHPNGLAEPSATDRAMAAHDGAIWAIIAAGRITLWRSGDAGFAALPYVVAPR